MKYIIVLVMILITTSCSGLLWDSPPRNSNSGSIVIEVDNEFYNFYMEIYSANIEYGCINPDMTFEEWLNTL